MLIYELWESIKSIEETVYLRSFSAKHRIVTMLKNLDNSKGQYQHLEYHIFKVVLNNAGRKLVNSYEFDGRRIKSIFCAGE